jgi:hypothetical protein
MQKLALFTADAEVTPKNLEEAMAQAIGIEIATIPVYLYTYYSITRAPGQGSSPPPSQDMISGQLVQELTAKGMPLDAANYLALDLSAQIMVFANKAGAVIMSVAIEEMLHMALASNVCQALVGTPQLIGKSPGPPWPVQLPGHEPEFNIDLAPFSLDQLMTFLKIESPDPLPKQLPEAAPLPYTTIGKFYDMIIECIETNDLKYQSERPQLVPGKQFYAQNNIDTVYYNKEHKPVYANADDSGDLIYVEDSKSAVAALQLIKEQGEGNMGAGLNSNGTVKCAEPTDPDFDDPAKKELCHFDKFAELYCDYEALTQQFNSHGLGGISDYFVLKVPTNPTVGDYAAPADPTNPHYAEREALYAVATLINAVYTYIFVMTEACYKQEQNTQWETFMFGIHKSMVFILNSLCGDIQGLTYEKDGQTYVGSATFENYPFGLLTSPKSQLVALYESAKALYPQISYLQQRFYDLPDVPLN